MHRGRFDGISWALCAAAVLAFAFAALGGSPIGLSAVTLVALWRSLATRWGLAGGLGAAVVAWMTASLVLVALAPALPFAMQAEVGAGLLALTCLAPFLGVTRSHERRRGLGADLAAASVGTLVWLVAVAASLVTPHGGGFSWAIYIDSSLDVFEIRKLAAYGGLNSLAPSNPRPFEHALSSSVLPWSLTLDSSATTFGAQVMTHAFMWTLLVALTCVLAGLVVIELTRGSHSSLVVRRPCAAAVSLVMLAAPVSGVVFIRGQINAHIVWVLTFACILIARTARRSPLAALALFIAAMTLLMLTWTPFAAIAGCLVVWSGVRVRSRVRGAGQLARLSLIGAVALFAWGLVCFAFTDLLNSALPSSSANESRVGVTTVFPNPAWLPLTLALLLIVAVCAWRLRRLDGKAAVVGALLVLGLGIGLAYLALAGGVSLVPTTYYPAKFLHLATVALVPAAAALVVNAGTRGNTRSRAVAAAAAGAVALMCVFAPLTPQVERWGSVPVDLVTGRWYGTRADVIDKVLSYSDNDVARLAWRADGGFDFYVNWMLSMAEPTDSRQFSTPFRSALRNYGDDMSAGRACDVADASDRPVVLASRDALLAEALRDACPDASIMVVTP